MPWLFLLVMVASVAITLALMPKTKTKPVAFDDDAIPKFEEGTPQQVIFGEAWTESWMVLGYGDLRTKTIRKSSWMGGSQVIGYKFFMGLHMGLFRGPINELVQIKVGDRVLWGGSITSNSTITVDRPGLFGGQKREGGIVGTVQVLMGGPTQACPAGLAAMLGGGPKPGFRGVTTVYFDGMVSAMSPYPKPWAFLCRRSTAGWYADNPWYPEEAVITLGAIKAANPAHMIYECLTNPQWGRGWPASKFNDSAWRATADQLHAEGFGLCIRWTRPDQVKAFVQSVLDHIGAALVRHPVTGLFELALIRGGYDPEDLWLYTADNGLLAIEDDDSTAQTVGVNEVVVEWHDPVKNETRQTRARNLGAIHSNGKITKKIEFPAIPTATLATLVAQRELRAHSGFVKRFKLRMDRRAYDRTPATLFRISDPSRGIADMIVRVATIEEGERDGAYTLGVLQDQYGLDDTTYVDDVPNTSEVPDVVVPPDTDEPTSITVVSSSTTMPPASPTDGATYLVPTSAGGAWAGHTGELAVWDADEAAWQFTMPSAGTIVHVQGDDEFVMTDGTGGIGPPPWGSPTTTEGDLIVRGASADTRLPAGTETHVLTIVDGVPAWAAPTGGSGGGPSPADYEGEVLSDGPVVYFPCSDAGSAATDLIGGLTLGFYNGAATGGSGPAAFSGRAINFPAINSGFNFPRPAAFTGTNSSVEMWFASASTLGSGSQFYSQAAGLLSDIGGTANDWGLGFQSTMRPIFGVGDVGSFSDTSFTPSVGAWNDGNWHHVVATRDSATGAIIIYVDGEVVAGGTGPTGTKLGHTVIWSGQNASGFVGRVAGLALYNSVLTPARITAHYLAGIGSAPSVVAEDSIFEAKGDLAVGNGASAAARLPVGPNGHVLTADSSDPAGVKWAAPTGGGGGGGGVNNGALVSRSTNLSVNSWTALPFTAEGIDDGNYWDSSAADRFTIPEEGWYTVNLAATWDATSTDHGLFLFKNGFSNTNVLAGNYSPTWASARQTTSYIGYFNAGDWIAFRAYSGATCNINAANEVASAAIHRLGGGASGAPVTPDTHPSSPNSMDDEFEGASLDAKWSWMNQGTSTASIGRGLLVLDAQKSGSSSLQQIRGIHQPLPAGSWKFRARVGIDNPITNYFSAGLFVINGANGKLITCTKNYNSGRIFAVDKHTNVTTYSGSSLFGSDLSPYYEYFGFNYFEIEYDGTNLNFRISATGADGTFNLLASEPTSTFLGAAPTAIGICCNGQNNSAPNRVIVDWFRRVA